MYKNITLANIIQCTAPNIWDAAHHGE